MASIGQNRCTTTSFFLRRLGAVKGRFSKLFGKFEALRAGAERLSKLFGQFEDAEAG